MPEYTVEFVGTEDSITVSDKQTILKRCIEEGIALEYSCRVGMCLACSAEIVEGEVEQTVATRRGLTEEEGQTYALTCMARPKSDLKLKLGAYPPSIENDAATGEAGAAFADD